LAVEERCPSPVQVSYPVIPWIYASIVQTIRTIRCKLQLPAPALERLFDLFAQACTRIARYGREHRESNAIRLHHALYREIRSESGLPANLVVTALRRAAGALKTATFKGRFQFRPTFVALDARTFTLALQTGEISFSTHLGHRLTAALRIGAYQHEALWSAHLVQSATLVKTRDGYYANIVVQSDVPESAQEGILGVDLGIRNIAFTSGSYQAPGHDLVQYRLHRWRIRASLLSKGTAGAKRALKRLSGRERRYATGVNHRVAKKIVLDALRGGCSLIRMEDLKGIRARTRVLNKHRNRLQAHWAFGQLQDFVAYKAAAQGIRTEQVPAWNTSSICHLCGRRGSRTRETFTCTPCGVILDADQNAAHVIAAGGAAVNRPESNGLAHGVT
jgi:putative transposase